jgi:xanthine dehydrogenase YagS FAD-binding subunit
MEGLIVKPFNFLAPATPSAAVAAVAGEPGAVFLGGGTNLVDHLRLGVVQPDLVVDVRTLTSRDLIDTVDGGLRIGAAASNSAVAGDVRIRHRWPVVAQALLAGASGQLRNVATTGGNPLQRTRCVYFQDVTTPCNKRVLGSGCSAVGGYTRYHAIFGTSGPTEGSDPTTCIATHPSDLAVALVAVDAEVQLLGPKGERSVPARELHRSPGERPDLDTVLAHGELITAIDLPPLPAGARSAYRKVRDRASYAFALVSVAAVLVVQDGVVADARLALGGVAHRPWRAVRAEAALRGQQATVENFRDAADAELAEAVAQPGIDGGNAFKLLLTARTIVAALRDLSTEGAAQ